MARIALAPGEEFEHYHSDVSTTTLREGEVRLSFGNQVLELQVGEVVVVPEKTPHTMCNVGDTPAVVECGHAAG